MASFFTQSSTIGVDLNTTSTTQLFALGTHVLGDRGSEWVYVQAATAVTLGKCVAISNAGTCAMVSATDMVLGTTPQLGFAQVAFAASDFGWVPIRGENMAILTTGSTSATAQVCVAGSLASTGMVSTVATASGSIIGVLFVSIAQTATATLTGAILTWPRIASSTVGP